MFIAAGFLSGPKGLRIIQMYTKNQDFLNNADSMLIDNTQFGFTFG